MQNYTNVVQGNTTIQPQIGQSNDITMISASNVAQQQQQSQQKPILTTQHQAVPQQVAANKRKFSETATYPPQPNAPIMQAQSFTQNAPQTRILPTQQIKKHFFQSKKF